MQKLPAASDKNVQRKGTVPTKGGISLSFSSNQQSANTWLIGGGRQCARL